MLNFVQNVIVQTMLQVQFAENVTSNSKTKILPQKKQEKETKSVRMTLLFRPSIQESLKRIAEKENTSINSLVCAAVESFIKGHENESS